MPRKTSVLDLVQGKSTTEKASAHKDEKRSNEDLLVQLHLNVPSSYRSWLGIKKELWGKKDLAETWIAVVERYKCLNKTNKKLKEKNQQYSAMITDLIKTTPVSSMASIEHRRAGSNLSGLISLYADYQVQRELWPKEFHTAFLAGLADFVQELPSFLNVENEVELLPDGDDYLFDDDEILARYRRLKEALDAEESLTD